MLNINILHLIKNKIIPITINYNIKQKNYFNKKFFYNNINKYIIEIFYILNFLNIIYLYIYKYISLKQKILLSTNYIQYIYILKLITILTTNYYISNNIYSGIFSNWIFFKKKLIIYKWLKYFFFINLIIKNNYKNIFYIYYILYFLYLKLKLKYHSLKNLNNLPNILIFIYLNNNKYLKEILKLNKNIIIINNNTNKLYYNNIIQININNKNNNIIYFILKIITTAIYHGILY